jgi:hypothetical protein
MLCALFGLANVVTIMYYIVDTTTGVSCNLPDAADEAQAMLHKACEAHSSMTEALCHGMVCKLSGKYRQAALDLQGDVEGKGYTRPPWLGFAVHVFNSMVAWADLAVRRSRILGDMRSSPVASWT